MCVFMDLIKIRAAWVYPSIGVYLNDGTKKVFNFVQSVYVDTGCISITRVEPVGDTLEHIDLHNVKYFKVINK